MILKLVCNHKYYLSRESGEKKKVLGEERLQERVHSVLFCSFYFRPTPNLEECLEATMNVVLACNLG